MNKAIRILLVCYTAVSCSMEVFGSKPCKIEIGTRETTPTLEGVEKRVTKNEENYKRLCKAFNNRADAFNEFKDKVSMLTQRVSEIVDCTNRGYEGQSDINDICNERIDALERKVEFLDEMINVLIYEKIDEMDQNQSTSTSSVEIEHITTPKKGGQEIHSGLPKTPTCLSPSKKNKLPTLFSLDSGTMRDAIDDLESSGNDNQNHGNMEEENDSSEDTLPKLEEKNTALTNNIIDNLELIEDKNPEKYEDTSEDALKQSNKGVKTSVRTGQKSSKKEVKVSNQKNKERRHDGGTEELSLDENSGEDVTNNGHNEGIDPTDSDSE